MALRKDSRCTPLVGVSRTSSTTRRDTPGVGAAAEDQRSGLRLVQPAAAHHLAALTLRPCPVDELESIQDEPAVGHRALNAIDDLIRAPAARRIDVVGNGSDEELDVKPCTTSGGHERLQRLVIRTLLEIGDEGLGHVALWYGVGVQIAGTSANTSQRSQHAPTVPFLR